MGLHELVVVFSWALAGQDYAHTGAIVVGLRLDDVDKDLFEVGSAGNENGSVLVSGRDKLGGVEFCFAHGSVGEDVEPDHVEIAE